MRTGWTDARADQRHMVFFRHYLGILDINTYYMIYDSFIREQARSQASRWGGGGLNLDGWNTIQARIQDFLKGGGGEDIHKHTPLGHCLRDVIRPSKNWKTPPLLDIHKHPPSTLSAWRHPPSEKWKNTPTLRHSPPPWTLPVWRHPHSKGGRGWSVPVTHTLHRFSVSGQVQGGGWSPPPWIRHRGWLISHSGAYFHRSV